jgi:hypothetical protein
VRVLEGWREEVPVVQVEGVHCGLFMAMLMRLSKSNLRLHLRWAVGMLGISNT